MKCVYTLVLIFTALNLSAQTSITLNMEQFLNGETIEFNKEAKNNLDNSFKINRLQYYVSGFAIKHDGGQTTKISDTYFLIDPTKQTSFDLGSHDVTNMESITFYVGVDRAKNHADPSQYSSEHPLAPKSPSMHWGWSAGYRFVAMEGKSGSSLNSTFEVHALGDNYYYPIEIPFSETAKDGAINVGLRAEYSKLLEGINVSRGLIVHGSYGEAVELLQNFRDHVFTNALGEGNVLSVSSLNLITGMYPNPSSGALSISMDRAINGTLEILDLQGKTLFSDNLNGKQYTATIDLKSGVYFVRVRQQNAILATKKWVISNQKGTGL